MEQVNGYARVPVQDGLELGGGDGVNEDLAQGDRAGRIRSFMEVGQSADELTGTHQMQNDLAPLRRGLHDLDLPFGDQIVDLGRVAFEEQGVVAVAAMGTKVGGDPLQVGLAQAGEDCRPSEGWVSRACRREDHGPIVTRLNLSEFGPRHLSPGRCPGMPEEVRGAGSGASAVRGAGSPCRPGRIQLPGGALPRRFRRVRTPSVQS